MEEKEWKVMAWPSLHFLHDTANLWTNYALQALLLQNRHQSPGHFSPRVSRSHSL